MPRASHDPQNTTLAGALASLEAFRERLADAALNCTPCPSCDGSVMLVIESTATDPDEADNPATWIVTLVPGGRLSLEAVIGETRLEMLAIGPADRILAVLRTLAEPVTVDA